jgi:hypothetical protein
VEWIDTPLCRLDLKHQVDKRLNKSRSAIGDKNGFQIPSSGKSDASAEKKEQMFPDNPARRGSISGGKKPPKDPRKVKAANESDVSTCRSVRRERAGLTRADRGERCRGGVGLI